MDYRKLRLERNEIIRYALEAGALTGLVGFCFITVWLHCFSILWYCFFICAIKRKPGFGSEGKN